MERNKALGYVAGIVGAASYGLNPLFALPCYSDGMDPNSVLFFRYVLSLPILALMIRFRGRSFRIAGRDVGLLAALGVVMAASSLSLYFSYNFMDVGIASSILFVYPVIVAVVMVLFYKERLSLLTVACLVMALVGIAMLYGIGGDATLSPLGTGLALTSALTYALYLVMVNRSRINSMPTVQLTFWVIFFSTLVYLAIAKGGWSLVLPHSLSAWLCLLGIAVFPTLVSFLCTTKAIHLIGPTSTAILGALEPVTAVFVGILAFRETLDPRSVAGVVLIILAVTLIVARSSVSSALLRVRRLFPRLHR